MPLGCPYKIQKKKIHVYGIALSEVETLVEGPKKVTCNWPRISQSCTILSRANYSSLIWISVVICLIKKSVLKLFVDDRSVLQSPGNAFVFISPGDRPVYLYRIDLLALLIEKSSVTLKVGLPWSELAGDSRGSIHPHAWRSFTFADSRDRNISAAQRKSSAVVAIATKSRPSSWPSTNCPLFFASTSSDSSTQTRWACCLQHFPFAPAFNMAMTWSLPYEWTIAGEAACSPGSELHFCFQPGLTLGWFCF